nr:serine hydrolase domain-containing protein [Rubrobacter marinus]
MSPFRKNTADPRTLRTGATRVRLALLAFIAVVVATVTISPALAQAPPDSPNPAPSAGRGPTDEREVEAFLDGYFAQQLEGHKIPGATVSVVKDGEVLFAKGYSEADVARGKPVVADETLFRIASTSKLFTSTAAMQLVEEGRLDLDEDVNVYLDDVEIPDAYPGRPVTLRHLLTHTAGFEQVITGSGARDAAGVEPLGEYLSDNVPERVRPPGEATSYSNYGMSLAGLVVEDVSGSPSRATSRRTSRVPWAWRARPSTSRPWAS